MRHAQDEGLADDDMGRVAPEGVFAAAEQRAVVGPGEPFVAILLEPIGAGLAVQATVDQATDADGVAEFELLHSGSHGGHASDDLVAWDARVQSVVPLVARGVEVGVTDSAVQDVNRNILVAGRTALDRERCQSCSRSGCGISQG